MYGIVGYARRVQHESPFGRGVPATDRTSLQEFVRILMDEIMQKMERTL